MSRTDAMLRSALLAGVALATTIGPTAAQDATPPPRLLEVEVFERTEIRSKTGVQVDEGHWRLRAIESHSPEGTTRHVLEAENRWVQNGVEKRKERSIAEGRRVLLVKNEFGAWIATWTNNKKADLDGYSLVGYRIDPGRWTEALEGKRGTIPISAFVPPLIEFHVDRLQLWGGGQGTWRVEQDPKSGAFRFLAEWKAKKDKDREVLRSLRIVVKEGPSKKPLPAKPKPPPVPCAPCDATGSVTCPKCRGAAQPCPSHGLLDEVECPSCKGLGFR